MDVEHTLKARLPTSLTFGLRNGKHQHHTGAMVAQTPAAGRTRQHRFELRHLPLLLRA